MASTKTSFSNLFIAGDWLKQGPGSHGARGLSQEKSYVSGLIAANASTRSLGIDFCANIIGVEEDRDSDIASVEPHVYLTVTISKGEGPFLEFICTGYAKEVSIDAMVFKHPQKKASDEGDRIPYDGPDFNDLDESLQKALRPRV